MWNNFKDMLLKHWRVPELEAFVLKENIYRLRIIAFVGGLVNFSVSIVTILDPLRAQSFFEMEIYLRALWIGLSLIYLITTTAYFVERHTKWMQWVNAITISLCLFFAALITGMPFADQSYLIVYYVNILLIGTLLYMSTLEMVLLALPSFLAIGYLYYGFPTGILHRETNMVNVFAIAFFAVIMAMMNYKLKHEHYKVLELLKLKNEALEFQANRDELTTLFNRRGGMVKLDILHRESDIIGSPYSIAMLDIDFFKQVNDQYGHDNGDLVLKEFSMCVKEVLNRNDICFRYGGEEFVILLPDMNLNDAYPVVEQLRQTWASKQVTLSTGQPFQSTVSIGLTQYSKGKSYQQLLQISDQALYHAKNMGRNKTVRMKPNSSQPF